MNNEKVKNHIHELELRHRKVDEQVVMMEQHHASDEDIQFFKKKRLALRDAITKMEACING